jgi:hypothetical protein
MWVVWSQKQVVVETSINNPTTHQWTAYPRGFYLAWGCNLRARIHYKDTWGVFRYEMPHPTCGGSASGDIVYRELVNLQPGSVWGQRSAGTAVSCAPMPSCFRYEGYTTWQVYPWAKHLKVTASPTSVLVGDSVTFTAARNDGYVLPSVERWIWVAKDSTQAPRTIACPTTSTVCRTPVYEDGWMFAQAQLDGVQTAWAGVNVTEARIRLTASQTVARYGQLVTYTAASDQPAGAPLQVTGWKFVPEDVASATTTPCGSTNPCDDPANAPGVMWVYGTLGGYRHDSASVRLRTYTEFTLEADRSEAFSGDTVRFTPKMDGQTVPASRWRWEPTIADPSDVSNCAEGTSECRKVLVGSGRMWAFVSSTPGQGDSASADVIRRRRTLILTPSDTQYVEAYETVTFALSAEGGGSPLNVVWAFAPDLSAALRPGSTRLAPLMSISSSSAAVGSSTCTSNVTTCWDEVLATYTRSVQATVDDSAQTGSVPIKVVTFSNRLVDGGSTPLCDAEESPECSHQALAISQQQALDSITNRLRTTDSAYCREARDNLRAILDSGRVYTYLMDNNTWGQYWPADSTRNGQHQLAVRHIDLQQRNWGARGCVAFSSQQPCDYRGRNHLESIWVHEGLHAIGRDHAAGDDFPRETVQRCMEAGHTDWGRRQPRP